MGKSFREQNNGKIRKISGEKGGRKRLKDKLRLGDFNRINNEDFGRKNWRDY